MKKEDFDFVSHQNEKKFVISEEEIEEACSDVDLNSIAASEDSEIDRLTRRRNSVHDSDSEYNADVEDDDNISYSSLALDKEIINSVLDGSDERMRAAANAKYKKICMYSLLILSLSAVVVFVGPDLMVKRDIQSHGSAFHYDDEDSFLEPPTQNVFDTPVTVDSSVHIAQAYSNVVNIRGPAFRKGELPFFVHHKDGSNMVEEVLSQCLGLAIAGTPTQEIPTDLKNSLSTFRDDIGRKYVTVDLSQKESILKAKEKNLASSGLADAVFTEKFYYAADKILSPDNKARLFTLIRHPVDRCVSEYYTFTQTAAEETLRELTLEEFATSKYFLGNWFTGFIAAKFDGEVTTKHLQAAKELLRTKYLVALQEDVFGAIELFEDYFFWTHQGSEVMQCKKAVINDEFNRDFAIFQKAGSRIKQNDDLYKSIIEKNQLDMELYWYAVELHRAQRAWIPKLSQNTGN